MPKGFKKSGEKTIPPSKKGIKLSLKHKIKIGLSKLGNTDGFKKGYMPWNKGKNHLVKDKNPKWGGGLPRCRVCKGELSGYKNTVCNKDRGYWNTGKKNWSWKGGITPKSKKLRETSEYAEWRLKCF